MTRHKHNLNKDGIPRIQEGYRGGMEDMLDHIAADQYEGEITPQFPAKFYRLRGD